MQALKTIADLQNNIADETLAQIEAGHGLTCKVWQTKLHVCVLRSPCSMVLCCWCMCIRYGLESVGLQAESSISGSTPHLEVWLV